MATSQEYNATEITSLTDIHTHLNMVVKEVKSIEQSFIDRSYTIQWSGLSTYQGMPGMSDGFTTNLRYRVYKQRADDPVSDLVNTSRKPKLSLANPPFGLPLASPPPPNNNPDGGI